jgi:hypothetical protein
MGARRQNAIGGKWCNYGCCPSRFHFRSACRKWSRLSLGFNRIRRSPSAPAQGCESKINISQGDFRSWDRRSPISGGKSPALSGCRSEETSLSVSLAHSDSRVSLTLAITKLYHSRGSSGACQGTRRTPRSAMLPHLTASAPKDRCKWSQRTATIGITQGRELSGRGARPPGIAEYSARRSQRRIRSVTNWWR